VDGKRFISNPFHFVAQVADGLSSWHKSGDIVDDGFS
jgi:hypothetical protein